MRAHDVVIAGGGLAGLTLSLHLRRELPDLDVAVVEPTRRPLPEACHKVGESSVEIGAHFFEHVLGLRDYLHERQLVKNGLRYFTGDTVGPLARRKEIGPSEHPVVPSFQLDRGRLENDLRAMASDRGVHLYEGWSVYDFALSSGESSSHLVRISGVQGAKEELSARWMIDASGRRRLIQKKLGLGRESGHDHNAAWFRITGRFDVASLVPESERAWHARDVDHNRWLSTVHLCGKGYWVWLIPLSSGFHSVGIVASEEHHPFASIARPETARTWLEKHEPVLAGAIAEMPMDDFLVLRKYAYTSEQVFSTDRWASVGEAGVFVDPLYSPGSDFIGLSNCISTELIRADIAGDREGLAERVRDFNEFFLGFTEVTLATFRGHSHINGAPGVLPAKLYWDNFHYWSFICPYFFNQIFRLPPSSHQAFRKVHTMFAALNVRAQIMLKTWAAMAPGEADGEFVPLPQFPSLLADLHLDLQNRRSPDETLAVMHENLEGAHEVVAELTLRALSAVGPGRARELATRTGFLDWNLKFAAARLDYQEREADRASLRKALPRIARDMDRCLGRAEGGEHSLRELLAIASSSHAQALGTHVA